MIKMTLPLWIRTFLIAALAAVVAQPAALASETSTGGGVISIQNEGDLTITFDSGTVIFVTKTGGPAGVSSSSGDFLYAEIPIKIVDERAEGARHPYSISLRLGTPTYGDYYIEESNIAFTDVSELPDGLTSIDLSAPIPADADILLIQSGNNPPTGTHTITISVRMYVPAGTVPGTYSGQVFLTQGGVTLPTN